MLTVSAPGRVEFLGNHTDYNRGLVLAAALDRRVTITGEARADRRVILISHERVEINLEALQPLPDHSWANYPLGVMEQFRQAGHPLGGFEATISSDLPAGAGLGSSAALEVAMAIFLQRLHGITLTPWEIAKLCQRAENEFVGVQSGVLDQATSVFGRADHLVHLDCASDELRTIPIPAHLALVIADSGTKHALVGSFYNERRAECAAAARALGLDSLREASLERLPLDAVLRRRAQHIVEENARVSEAVAALSAGDDAALGALLNASHESSRSNFENSTPALDRLVTRARELPGVLGARLTGGGFGGSVLILAQRERAEQIATALRAEAPAVFVCRIGDGAAILAPVPPT